MSTYQAIENGLKSINGTVFQELCDSYLKLKNDNYIAFFRTGSQIGKQKTRKGTPDSYFLLPNGNFIYVEITTDISTKNKLVNDINACFDQKKTQIPPNRIEEIIICINWMLPPDEANVLFATLREHSSNTKLRIVSLQEMAIDLQFNYRQIAKEYLGITIGSGQLISMDKFIEEYNSASGSIATPINNQWVDRTELEQELNNLIASENIIVVTGPAGVGKTRVCLKCIDHYLNCNYSARAFCVSYKHHSILDDLHYDLNQDGDYLIFVDDANRVDAISQLVGFYKSFTTGSLKLIFTVRDYAYSTVQRQLLDFSSSSLEVDRLTDEQIVKIISGPPFEIGNNIYSRKIVDISDGNPRLAIMASLLAKKEQRIGALTDVSELFKSYFETFLRDDIDHHENMNQQALGITAFFFAFPFKNKEKSVEVLEKFGLNYSDFIDSIEQLERYELVEVQYDYVKIPEQNLSTYFFYRSFIDQESLSFSVLLSEFFHSDSKRFKECVVAANNTFGPGKVMEKLTPYLRDYFYKVYDNEDSVLNLFSVFWFYLVEETLVYLSKSVAQMVDVEPKKYTIDYQNNSFSHNRNRILEILTDMLKIPLVEFDSILSIIYNYVNKNTSLLPELIHSLQSVVALDEEDERTNLYRQQKIISFLTTKCADNDKLGIVMAIELSNILLKFYFSHSKNFRGNTITIYNYPFPLTPTAKCMRGMVWDMLIHMPSEYHTKIIDTIQNYMHSMPGIQVELVEYDKNYLMHIFNERMNPKVFFDSLVVHQVLNFWSRNSVEESELADKIRDKYNTDLYKMYLKVDWNRYRDEELYEFEDHREYDKIKTADIVRQFQLNNYAEVDEFVDNFITIKGGLTQHHSIEPSLDVVINSNFSRDLDIGLYLLQKVIKSNDRIGYIPRLVFFNHLGNRDNTEAIWHLLISSTFEHQSKWKVRFFENLKSDFIDDEILSAFFDTIKSLPSGWHFDFGRVQNFTDKYPEFFVTTLKLINTINATSENKIIFWTSLFQENDDLIQKYTEEFQVAYMQQKQYQAHYDHNGEAFIKLLRLDKSFLLKYIDSLYARYESILNLSSDRFGYIWSIEAIEYELEAVFDKICNNEKHIFGREFFVNSFFTPLREEDRSRAYSFILSYARNNSKDDMKINIAVDIVRKSMPEIYEQVINAFLDECQDVEIFSKIWWRGNGGAYSGEVIVADVEASDWMRIQGIVQKLPSRIELLPIKLYIKDKIDNCKVHGDFERQRKFVSRF
ncbi:ATP-binding protein [Neolewinella sp.]|uniref:nSTAND3 domain-containing NTPase n=1 Tax=Neolewinella sp. TaxID=2993543 RepID=UPI003B52ACF7